MATLRNKDEAFNWSGTGGVETHWEEETSPGVWGAHTGNPTASDDVWMHGSHTVTITGNVACRSLRTESGFTGMLKHNTTATIEVGTSTAPPENWIWRWTAGTYKPEAASSIIKFVATVTTNQTTTVLKIEMGGQSPRLVIFAGKEATTTFSLEDDLKATEVELTLGEFQVSHEQTWSKFSIPTSTKNRGFTVHENIKIVLTGTTTAYNAIAGTGTFTAEWMKGSVLELQGTGGAFKPANVANELRKVIITGANYELTNSVELSVLEIVGVALLVTKGKTILFTAYSADGELIVSGAAAIESKTAGSAIKVKKTKTNVNVTGLKLKDCTAEGGVTWLDKDGTNVSGNTGWTFSTTTEIVLAAAASESSASVAVTAATGISLAEAASVSAAVASVSAKTTIAVSTASSTSSATGTVSALTAISLASAISESSASGSVSARTQIALSASESGSATTLAASAATTVSLQAGSSSSTASAGLSAAQTLTLAPAASVTASSFVCTAAMLIAPGEASASSSTSIALGAATTVTLDPASSSSATDTLAVGAAKTIPLQPAASESAAEAEVVIGGSFVSCQTASSASSASAQISAATQIGLEALSATSATATSVSAAATIVLGAVSALGSASIALRVPTTVSLQEARSSSTAEAHVEVRVPVVHVLAGLVTFSRTPRVLVSYHGSLIGAVPDKQVTGVTTEPAQQKALLV